MTNEPKKVELYGQGNDGQPRRFTVANATGIEKNTFLELTDPRTAVTAVTAGAACAGISAMEKEANDGSTSISAWTDGIFECTASGAIVLGAPVMIASTTAHPNTVKTATPHDKGGSGAVVLGYCMETAADAERVNIRLDL